MTEREKLVGILTDLEEEDEFVCDSCVRANKPICIESLANRLIAHGVTVKKPQKPVKFNKMPLSDYCWIEHKYTLSSTIGPAEILCIMDKYCRINFIGCGSPIVHKKADYGKEWRCWAEKPTEEERKAAEWE